jgi:hypothetical protein
MNKLLLRIFIALKNPMPSARLEPAKLESNGKHVKITPPRATCNTFTVNTFKYFTKYLHYFHEISAAYIRAVSQNFLKEY